MVRGGNFTWPPGWTQYPWTGLNGYIPAALIFHRAGYPAFQIQDQAAWRTHEYLWFLKKNTSTDWWYTGHHDQIKHLVKVVYPNNRACIYSNDPTLCDQITVDYPVGMGGLMGYTDWTHPNGI